jgi:hypothetical protein
MKTLKQVLLVSIFVGCMACWFQYGLISIKLDFNKEIIQVLLASRSLGIDFDWFHGLSRPTLLGFKKSTHQFSLVWPIDVE